MRDVTKASIVRNPSTAVGGPPPFHKGGTGGDRNMVRFRRGFRGSECLLPGRCGHRPLRGVICKVKTQRFPAGFAPHLCVPLVKGGCHAARDRGILIRIRRRLALELVPAAFILTRLCRELLFQGALCTYSTKNHPALSHQRRVE